MLSNDALYFNSILVETISFYENVLEMHGFVSMAGAVLQMTSISVGVFAHPLASSLGYELSVSISNQKKNKIYYIYVYIIFSQVNLQNI